MANGLVLTGEIRNVKVVNVKPDGGEAFDQTRVIVDTGDDFLPQVNARQGEERLAEDLRGRIGEVLSLRVTLGKYGKLYLDGVE